MMGNPSNRLLGAHVDVYNASVTDVGPELVVNQSQANAACEVLF